MLHTTDTHSGIDEIVWTFNSKIITAQVSLTHYRVELNMVDTHSGIDEIIYEVHEVVSENETKVLANGQGSEKGQTVDQVNCKTNNSFVEMWL